MPKRVSPRGEAAPPVEPNVANASIPRKPAAKRRAPAKPKVEAETQDKTMYVRNRHHITARVTLTSGREIELKPRGQREDVDIVTEAEQQDPKFIANEGIIFEVITPAEAADIIRKQQTNASGREHELWQYLRNERGDAYEKRNVEVEIPFERQGQVVGRVVEEGSGRFTDKNSGVYRAMGPQQTTVPGSAGDPATNLMNSLPAELGPEEYHEFLLWKQFREQQRLAEQGQQPSEGHPAEGLKVTVEPVRPADGDSQA